MKPCCPIRALAKEWLKESRRLLSTAEYYEDYTWALKLETQINVLTKLLRAKK